MLYTEKFGKKTYLAKGVRKLKSKKRGGLEVFSFIKFSAVSAKGYEILTETELINAFPLIRNDLKRMSLAYYFSEIIGRISSENQPNTEAYDLLLTTLTNLTKSNDLKGLRRDFVLNSLVIFGFWEKDRKITDPDILLSQVLERELNSVRVGKKVLR